MNDKMQEAWFGLIQEVVSGASNEEVRNALEPRRNHPLTKVGAPLTVREQQLAADMQGFQREVARLVTKIEVALEHLRNLCEAYNVPINDLFDDDSSPF